MRRIATRRIATRLGPGVLLPVLLLATSCQRPVARTWPDDYPRSYASLALRAADEGRLTIWGATGKGRAQGLLAAFAARFPAVRVTYVEKSGAEIYRDFLAAVAAHAPLPDLVWSSAMDLQIKLVNDGYAQTYASPEAAHMAPWANWKDQAWGTTAEPIVMVYNRRRIADAQMPRSHLALARFLEGRAGKPPLATATYDVPNSAVGYLYLSQDQQASHGLWRLLGAMRRQGLHTFPDAEAIMADVRSGRAAIGYDLVGSYALGELPGDPDLGMVLPQDYTLVVSRIAMIPAAAAHPAAARVFLDFLLSAEGQRQLARQRMSPVRADVPAPAALAPREARFRAIRVGPNLLVDSDALTRAHVLARWRAALSGSEPAAAPPR